MHRPEVGPCPHLLNRYTLTRGELGRVPFRQNCAIRGRDFFPKDRANGTPGIWIAGCSAERFWTEGSEGSKGGRDEWDRLL